MTHPAEILCNALQAKCLTDKSPIQSLVELATKAGVGVKTIAKAASGRPVPTIEHLRLCTAIELDPMAGVGPAYFGLKAGYPEPADFIFGFFALALTLRQRFSHHGYYKASEIIGIQGRTLERLKAGHAMPIGPVLRACSYIGAHPFTYLGAAHHLFRESVSREICRETCIVS
jgi:hypothetical protein